MAAFTGKKVPATPRVPAAKMDIAAPQTLILPLMLLDLAEICADGAAGIAPDADSVDGCYDVAMARGVVLRGGLRGGRG